MSPRAYKCWVFTKTQDYTLGGTLQLGQILAEPFEPGHSLMPNGPPPIPSNIKVEDTSKFSVTMDSTDDLKIIFGLWAKVASLPVSAEAGGKVDRSNELSWHFEKLSSKIMSPSLGYIEDAMRHGDVPQSLKKWRFKKRIYMITGVRIAHGARMVRKDSQSIDLHGKAEGDLSSTGAPAAVGGKGGVTEGSSNAESFERATDFVYAYRLNEVNYQGRLSHKPFKRGEVAGVGGGEEGAEAGGDVEEEMVDFDVEGIEEEAFDEEDFD